MSEDQFSDQKFVMLESYGDNGNPIQSPVWILEDGGIIYFRTDPSTGKVRRIQSNPIVRIAPADISGEILGSWVKGEAHFIEGVEAKRVFKLFRKKYGIIGRIIDFFNRLRGRKMTVVVGIRIST